MADERIQGPTPAGGAYAVASFFDAAGDDAEKADATRAIVREFDADDRMIAETWADVQARR